MLNDNRKGKNTVINVTVLLAILICGGYPGSACFASRSGDLEYWQAHDFSFDLDKDVAFTVSQELRFGRSGSEPHLYNVDMGLVYSGLADWLALGFNFRKEYEKDSSGTFRHENRPHFNVTLKGSLFDIPTSNRSRIEWRDFQNKKEQWRFRNKTTIKLPFKFTKFNLQPYIAEEIFIKVGEDNINQNRLSSGFSCKLTENISASVFYMWKTSKITGGWRDTNVIGTQFKFLF